MSFKKPAKKIAIIGAGNAGCITALELLANQRKNTCEITIFHNPASPIENVGQGSLPAFTEILSEVLKYDWYNNPINATIKTGILYQGWGKKQFDLFHPFPMGNVAAHYSPHKLSKAILESGLVTVKEIDIVNPEKEIDATAIFDCRGKHNRPKENYDTLISPINSVLLSKRIKLPKDNHLLYTTALATANGWMFIIPGTSMIYYGYLYNNNITSYLEASEDFIYNYNIPSITEHFTFENYVAKNMFVNERTILQGNAYGFIEPLEATAVNFYQDLCSKASEVIFNNEDKQEINTRVKSMMSQIETFLLWHYQFGSKYNTPFWDYAKSLPFNPDEQFKYIMSNLNTNRKYYNWTASQSFKNWKEGVS